MLEIRKHPTVRSTVYITGFDVRVPADGSWAQIPTTYTKTVLEEIDFLKQAYEKSLIEIRVDGNYDEAPNWFFEPYRSWVSVPTSMLKGDVSTILARIDNVRSKAHPIIWYISREELLELERKGNMRKIIMNSLNQASSYKVVV